MCVFSDISTQLNATRLHSNSEKLPESDRFLLTAMDWVRNSDAMFHCDEYNSPLPPNTPDSQFRNVICPTRSCCHRRSIHLYSRTAHGCVGSTGSDASHLHFQNTAIHFMRNIEMDTKSAQEKYREKDVIICCLSFKTMPKTSDSPPKAKQTLHSIPYFPHPPHSPKSDRPCAYSRAPTQSSTAPSSSH